MSIYDALLEEVVCSGKTYRQYRQVTLRKVKAVRRVRLRVLKVEKKLRDKKNIELYGHIQRVPPQDRPPGWNFKEGGYY